MMEILYLEGDACSPKYVRGVLKKAGFTVDAVVAEPVDREHEKYDAYLLSDFTAEALHDSVMRAIVEDVRAGAGLVMTGGWTSLGRGGYARSPLADVLPVVLTDGDDRVNLPAGTYPRALANHAITRDLPWGTPPVLAGVNHVEPKGDADVLVETWDVASVQRDGAAFSGTPRPLLVTRPFEAGRVAVFTGDLAPHWSGGFTDWGTPRVDVGGGESVGAGYYRFVTQLLAWAGDAPVPDAVRDLTARST